MMMRRSSRRPRSRAQTVRALVVALIVAAGMPIGALVGAASESSMFLYVSIAIAGVAIAVCAVLLIRMQDSKR